MPRTARYLAAIAIALALPAFLSATAWAGEPLSKKEFLKQGNAICAAADDQIGALAEEAFGAYENSDTEPPPEAVEAFAAGLVPILRPAIAELDALEPPTKDTKKVQKIIDTYSDAVDQIEADPSVLLDEQSGDVFRKGNKLARKYGLKECADED